MAVPEGTADILERTKFVHKSTSSTIEPPQIQFPTAILDGSDFYGKKLPIGHKRTCQCGPTHINCMTAKEWLKSQLGVWQFYYEGRDIRDKTVHPATFPISLAKKIIELFTPQGELVLDPFVRSGTTLIAANDLNRNCVGFDLQAQYVEL